MNCLTCNTTNPSQAHYCYNCGAALTRVSLPRFSTEIPTEITRVQSLGYMAVGKVPMPYWIVMILLWQLLFLGDFLIAKKVDSSQWLLFYFLLYSTFSSAMILIEYANRQMQNFFPRLMTFVDAPQEVLKTWYAERLRYANQSWQSLAAGVVFMVLGSISIYPIIAEQSGYIPELTWYRMVTNALGFFLQGTGCWSLYGVLRLTNQLAKFKINVQLFAVGNDSVMALGNVFLRLSLALTGTYSMIVLADIVGGLYDSDVIIFWNVFGIICILCFFIVPQYRIHKLMVQEKQARLKAFSTYLESSVNECLQQPSKERLDHLKGLFELKEHLSQMHEWSFRTRTISQLISVLLIPLLLVILEVYLSS